MYGFSNKKGQFNMSQADADGLVWWMANQVRNKVLVTRATLPANEGLPVLNPTGLAPTVPVELINITGGSQMTLFLAKFSKAPHRYFDLQFPNCGNALIRVAGSIVKSSQAVVQPGGYMFSWHGATYPDLAQHLETLLASPVVNEDAEVLFGDMIKAIKGKAVTSIGGAPAVDLVNGISAVVTMAGSEGTRCLGMLAAAVMALSLMKYGEEDIDSMFVEGGWPAVGKETQAALQEIDFAAYQRSLAPPVIALLSPKATKVFDKLSNLIALYVLITLDRDKNSERVIRGSTRPKAHRGINSDAAFLAAARNVISRKVLAHI